MHGSLGVFVAEENVELQEHLIDQRMACSRTQRFLVPCLEYNLEVAEMKPAGVSPPPRIVYASQPF